MTQESLQTIAQNYKNWLIHRERSPATIQKYTRALARFFAETNAPAAPPKETVAAWRDALAARAYTPAAVNALLAAVNGYQESIGNAAAKARPLKCQRRVYCDAERELTRDEYFRLLAAARDAGDKRTLLLLQTLCATGIRVSELQYITVEAIRRRKAHIRCKGKCREILLPAALCDRLARWCRQRRVYAGPVFVSRQGGPLSRVTVWKLLKALCGRAQVAWKKVFPHNLRHLFARTFYAIEKISRNWRTCSVTPASRRRASISWNRALNTPACLSVCTFYCEIDEISVLLSSSALSPMRGIFRRRIFTPFAASAQKKAQKACWAKKKFVCPTDFLRLSLAKSPNIEKLSCFLAYLVLAYWRNWIYSFRLVVRVRPLTAAFRGMYLTEPKFC